MLTVSKKKLRFANALYYFGIVSTIAWLLASILWGLPRLVTFVFIAIMLVGSDMRLSLFKCPKCGKRLFTGATKNDIRHLNVPAQCPSCEIPIEVEYVD